jgi:hypothetical protein
MVKLDFDLVIDLGNLCEPRSSLLVPRPRPPQRVHWRLGSRIAGDNQRRELAGLPELVMISCSKIGLVAISDLSSDNTGSFASPFGRV